MRQELERFLILFDSLFEITNKWVETAPPEKYDWVPVDNPHMKFGERIGNITLKTIYIHIILGEANWARTLKDCDDGAEFGPNPNSELTEKLMGSDDFVAEGKKIHAENMALFRTYGDDQLAKNISWIDRRWTVMGFLWAIYCHRAYHLGNIDIYLREADLPAPDFFSSFRPVMA